VNSLLQDFFSGDTRALARVITQVENRTEESLKILQALFSRTGRARVIGITGSPGVGKSSLVDRLAAAYRQESHAVGVVAVDPSSPFTGGAILGDRIRMQGPGVDSGVYIRSMATRGNLGGLAATTADVVSVLDAAGRDPILVETVGVGQDEIEIVRLADISVVVLVPGLGDDVQAIKAGIMEIGDLFVINKSDQPGSDKLELAIKATLALGHGTDGWMPPVVKTVATEGAGIDQLTTEIERALEFFKNSSRRTERRRDAERRRLLALLEERLLRTTLSKALPNGELNRIVDEIAERKQDPYSVVERICKSITLESQ
jgi:LAO/AO transport system kinase